MGFEPTTTCLGSKDSTTELRPLNAKTIRGEKITTQIHDAQPLFVFAVTCLAAGFAERFFHRPNAARFHG